MDIVVSASFGVGAAVVWLVLAASLALLAGRVIHERDAHDRPLRPRAVVQAVTRH